MAAPQTILSIDAILKDYYIGPLQEQLNNEVMVLQMFEKAKISWAGKQGVVPVHLSRNSGVAFRGDGADLKAAGTQGTKRFTFQAAYLYGRFEVTGPAIAAAAKGGTASFIGALELEMDKLKDDVRDTADRTAISGGHVVGFLNQRRNATTDWEFRGDLVKLGAALTAKGGNLDVAIVNCTNLALVPAQTASYEAIAGAGKVVAATFAAKSATGKIDFDAAYDTTVLGVGYAAAVVIDDADAGVDYLDDEPIGVYGNLASESLFGVDRGQVANDATGLQSVIMAQDVDASGAAEDLSLMRMQEVIDNISITSGMEPTVIMMNPIDRAQYINLLQGTVQMNAQGSAQSGDGGFLGLSYAGIPIKSARHVDRGLMLFLNTKCWKLAVLEDGKFADLDGSVLSRVVGKDSWEGFYKWYYQHYCYRPNANGILTGLTWA